MKYTQLYCKVSCRLHLPCTGKSGWEGRSLSVSFDYKDDLANYTQSCKIIFHSPCETLERAEGVDSPEGELTAPRHALIPSGFAPSACLKSSGYRRRRWRQLSSLQGLSGRFYRNADFAGDADLTESATISGKMVGLFHVFTGAGQMLPAFFLVVARFGNRPDRTTVDTLAAGSVSIKETVVVMPGIRARGRGKGDFRHHRAKAHRLAAGGDQSVAKAESPESCSKCRMPFRP